MKVVQLLYSGMGGHGSVAFSLLNADKEHKWQPVMCFLGIEPLLSAYQRLCSDRGIEHQYFNATSGKPWRTWLKIYKWLNVCRPDAIILHSSTALLPCFFYSFRRGATLVMVEHQPNALKRSAEWLFSFLAMLLADRVIVLTAKYRKELQERLGIYFCSNKIRLVPNGIDTTRFMRPDKPLIHSKTVRLGMAARFTTMKRQDILLEMIEELRRVRPEINWQLSLAGGGENWHSVCHEVQSRNLWGCISLPGQLDEPELIRWFQGQDIYLHASEGETLSTSLLQAMASGLPVVASDVLGIRDLLGGEPICGVLIGDQSPLGFAEAVMELASSASYAEALALSGRRLVVSSYSQDEMFSGYVEALTVD